MSLAYTEIALGGRNRKVRYAIRDLRDLERVLAKPLGDAVADMTRLGAEPLSIFLWAGLKHEDRPLTIEKTLDLIQEHVDSGGEISDIRQAVNDALVLSGYFGQKAKAEVEAAHGANPPTPTATSPSTSGG